MLKQKCPKCGANQINYEGDYANCMICGKYTNKIKWWQKILLWSRGKNPWVRLLPLAYFIIIYIDLRKGIGPRNNSLEPLEYLNFGIHELGHLLFSPFGDFMRIAGGSLFQIIFPILWMAGFIQKRMYFAASLCFCWMGQNLYDVAHYAADAQDRLLPLSVGPAGLYMQGDDQAYDNAHDWYQLLTRTDQLNNTEAIAVTIAMLGNISFIVGFILSLTLIYYMIRLPRITN